MNVLSLVQRWLINGQNRGFYLRSRGTAWPIRLHGRMAANAVDRPTLTVVTNTGTFVLTAAANATWNKTSATGYGSAVRWALAEGSQPAILRFDLSSITGTPTAATLTVRPAEFEGGRTGQIIDVFECDPPIIVVPENVPSPARGIAAGYLTFNAMKSSGHPDLLFADDFEAPGFGERGWTPAAARAVDPVSGTTYARGTISAGGFGSADVRADVSKGTGASGAPDLVVDDLYGQYWLYLESDFGTTADTAIKIPSMGVQFGYWNPVGYWQQTTGNGGSRGTGLKVWNTAHNKWEYQGHSIRLLTGVEPTALDDDPYAGWFGIGIYPYNLDQGGPFPAGEAFPNVAIRKEQSYCIDIRIKQNSMSGSQDANGNYANANPDGVFQAWINGHLVYSRTDYRWRRHPEFGVQGMWVDVYHGGILPAPRDMHYRIDRVALARSYIGMPPR